MSNFVFVFDLDDTLYLERDYVKSGFESVGRVLAADYGVLGAAEYAWRQFERGHRGAAFNDLLTHFDLPVTLVPTLVELYRDHSPAIDLLPDADAFLRNLPTAVAEIGMITDGFAGAQRKKLQSLELTERIPHIMVTGEHGEDWRKPSELPFAWIEDRCALQDATYVYFADNPAKDFHAPKSRGWRTVRLWRDGGIYSADTDHSRADFVVRSFAEVDASIFEGAIQ